VACRRTNLAYRSPLMGDVGQIEVMQANVRMPSSVDRALEGSDAVINLVGVLYEQGRQRFSSLHAQGARNIAEAAKARGIKTLIQVSAIGADADSASKYARTKAEGEAAARHSVPTATVVRPSIVFGSEDDFFNRFGALAARTPALPLPGGGQTRFQPVFVNDVAAAIAACVTDPATRGQTYELGGPATFSFKELMRLVLSQTQRRRLLVPLPWPLARLIGVGGDLAAAMLPIAPPLTSDQVELLTQDNVVSGKLPGLADLGVTPTAVEVVVPTYLYRYRKGGQFAGDMPLVSAG
ncbi:MAG TPA: complex I NDUFA9 subunit family protein, partial [Caulobacteraceae bacterium]|nr:complex I NDUFA9 subunit family protein [Caulobacteraceae bacterium]